MNTRKIQYQVIITILFGILAFLIRAFNLITPLGDLFVLDLRDFFVAIGSAIGGPVSGLVIGILAGIPARLPAVDIASFAVAGLAVGFFSGYFYHHKIRVAYAALFMLGGYFVAFLLIVYLGMWNNVPFLLARAAICTPVNIFILNNLFSTYPKILAVARFS
jgi:LytS/YehU family sensor histidine kinase